MINGNLFGNLMPPEFKNGRLSKKATDEENKIEYLNYLMLFDNLVLDTFEYKGLPKTCDARMIELNLLYRGMACIYKDENGNFWSYGATISGKLTNYGYPDDGRYYAINGINGPCKYAWPFMDNTNANAVLCLDNKMGYPFINYVDRCAFMVSDAKRSAQTAFRLGKMTALFQCRPEQAKSLRAQVEDIQNNNLLIIETPDNDFTNSTNIFDTNKQVGSTKEAWETYLNVLDDAKDLLGIRSNKQSDKKERLITAEVMCDDEYIENILATRLEERKKFCERCNEFFGLNMSVELKNKKDIKIFDDELKDEGGNDNENDETI